MSSNAIGPGILRYSRWPLIRYSLLILAVAGASLFMWPGLLRNLLSESFMPHGMCLLWEPKLLWLHVVSDSAIGLSYVAISLTLAWLVHRARNDIPFHWIFLAFGLFIIACGGTHFMEVVTLWKPYYWLSGDIKLITAIASVATAIVLPPLVPKTLAMIQAAKISEERKARIEAQNRELELMTRRLRELDELKTQFFANVSHELRTPLALTLGRTEKLLSADDLAANHRRELQVVHRNARSLLKQVNDLLDISKLEAGRMGVTYAETDLARLVRRIVANFDSLATDRRLTFVYKGPESLTGQLDEEKIERILLNLLSNAFKFTPDGGTIRCELRGVGDELQLVVADSGPGVSPEMRSAVFERFRQLEGGNARKFGGTGLGLAIVKDMAELHGGTVQVSDAPEGGAEFVVRVPWRAPGNAEVAENGSAQRAAVMDERAEQTVEELQPSEPVTSEPNDIESAGASAPLVLVVEDNAEMNRFIVESLAGEYRVVSALDGAEGLRKAVSMQPDLILSDVMMPHLSGEDLLRELRSRPEFAATPVILLTAKADQRHRVHVLRLGAQDYIMKPFSVEELRVRVRNLTSMSVTRRLLQQELNSQSHNVEELAHEVSVRTRQLHSALDALRVSESRFRRLVESNLMGVITAGSDGTLLEANDAFLKMVGYTRDELNGGMLNLLAITAEDYVEKELEALQQLSECGVAGPWQKEIFSKDGSRVPVLVGTALLEGSNDNGKAITFVLDLTQQKRAEAANAELAAIVESSDDAIIGKTLDGRITSWNRGAERIYGYRAEEILGRDIAILSPPDREGEMRDILLRIGAGQNIEHLQTQRMTKDGRRIEVSLSASLVRNSAGQIVGASTIARDITELKRAEEALRNSEKHATVGRLAATMAHEINNPLEAVSNVLYLLSTWPNLDVEGRQYVAIASQEMERIAHIVKQTLGFYRESTAPVFVDLAKLVDSVLALYSRKLQDKRLKVEKRFEPAAPVPGFPAEMRQVFSNLIVNAVEATEPGGMLKVHVFSSRDWRHPSRAGVRVVVCDNGSGIPPDNRSNLFEPFFTTKGEKGTGLGLWVTNGIVQKHAGILRVHSSVRARRSGTCFSVFFPGNTVGPNVENGESQPTLFSSTDAA